MKKITKCILVCAGLLLFGFNALPQSMDYNILVEDIEFQPGVTIDINVNVYVNENAHNWADHGKIFAIEGMAHTANCWKPLAEELFLRPDPQLEVNEFYAIDMPGRGGSGLPEGEGFLLHNMYLADYLVVIENVLEHLNEVRGVHPSTIMGHSMGGLEVIMLQNKLIDEGTNLRKEFKIKNAVLLAPGIPAPLDWAMLTNGGAAQLASFATFQPGAGVVLNIPCMVWPYIFFTNLCCYFMPEMVPGAPSGQYVCDNGYSSIEPGPLLYELSGMDPGPPFPYKPRISADEDIFVPRHGVQLTIIADEFDKMMRPDEEEDLYEYLTGDKHYKGFHVVMGEETCHDTHISDPHALVEILNRTEIFKNKETGNNSNRDPQYKFSLSPNPALHSLRIDYFMVHESSVSISLYDTKGSLIKDIQNESGQPGWQFMVLEVSDLKPGIYFCRMTAGDTTLVKKMVVAR